MKLQFDCFFYHVTDLERAVLFYRDVLGLQLQSRDAVARFKIDEVLFELVPDPESIHQGGKGNGKLCLQTEDLSLTIEKLRLKGVDVSDPKRVDNGILAFFRDPDGNEICLWRYKDQRETSAR